MSDKKEQEDFGTDVILEEDIELHEPKQYKVLLHNDDYTPMNFVIEVLQKFFFKSHHEATYIMLKVHQEGIGVCGIYPYEIAETKVARVQKESERFGYPLKSSMEQV